MTLLALKFVAAVTILVAGVVGGTIPLLAPVTMRAADSFRWAMPWQAASFSAQGSFTCYLMPARRWRG